MHVVYSTLWYYPYIIISECPSSCGKPNLNNVHVVNLSLVSDVHVKEDVNTVPEPPQSLNLDRVSVFHIFQL